MKITKKGAVASGNGFLEVVDIEHVQIQLESENRMREFKNIWWFNYTCFVIKHLSDPILSFAI